MRTYLAKNPSAKFAPAWRGLLSWRGWTGISVGRGNLALRAKQGYQKAQGVIEVKVRCQQIELLSPGVWITGCDNVISVEDVWLDSYSEPEFTFGELNGLAARLTAEANSITDDGLREGSTARLAPEEAANQAHLQSRYFL